MIIELNARPGLAIQVANYAGLAPRVAIIEALKTIDANPESRAEFSKKQFSTGTTPHPLRTLRTRSSDGTI